MNVIILIGAVILAVMLLLQFWNAERIPKNTVIGFVGTLGSGKTYMAVKLFRAAYKRQRLKYSLRWIPFFTRFFPEAVRKPSAYSNIPVKIGFRKLTRPLTKEHLLMSEKLPEGAVVLIDEIGAFASQWEFDNPLIMEQVTLFIRLFRHFVDGRMFITDQTSDNIVKPIRTRLGMIYSLNDFRRWLKISPFFKVNVNPLLVIEDNNTRIEEEYSERFFFGMLPYKWMKIKNYQSRCYKPLYSENAVREIPEFRKDMYTNYLIDISVSQEVRKDYRKDQEKYKAYLYNREKEPVNGKEKASSK